ncbi:MAG: hypothetical protein KAU38_07500 [Desulfobacterales bacterium]|nr:hypothetical protein [Desulfobacterales bacterium]
MDKPNEEKGFDRFLNISIRGRNVLSLSPDDLLEMSAQGSRIHFGNGRDNDEEDVSGFLVMLEIMIHCNPTQFWHQYI